MFEHGPERSLTYTLYELATTKANLFLSPQGARDTTPKPSPDLVAKSAPCWVYSSFGQNPPYGRRPNHGSTDMVRDNRELRSTHNPVLCRSSLLLLVYSSIVPPFASATSHAPRGSNPVPSTSAQESRRYCLRRGGGKSRHPMKNVDLGSAPPAHIQAKWDEWARTSPPQRRGWAVVGVAFPMVVIVAIFIAARLWACMRIYRKFNLSDYLAVIGGVGEANTVLCFES